MPSKSSKILDDVEPGKKKPKREVYYVRVKEENKRFMEKKAEEHELSLSDYTDQVFDNLRKG